jgi:hypothetical protein
MSRQSLWKGGFRFRFVENESETNKNADAGWGDEESENHASFVRVVAIRTGNEIIGVVIHTSSGYSKR